MAGHDAGCGTAGRCRIRLRISASQSEFEGLAVDSRGHMDPRRRRDMVKTKRSLPFVGAALTLLAGCASAPVTVVPAPPANYGVLGQ